MTMKEWFSPSEIADLGLIGYLNSKRAVNAWITKAKPFQDAGSVRRRLGSGGGLEYHLFALLPYITDDRVKAEAAALLGERMLAKQSVDSLGAPEPTDSSLRPIRPSIDLAAVSTDNLVSELLKRAGLPADERDEPRLPRLKTQNASTSSQKRRAS